MLQIGLYVHKACVYIPLQAKTEAGFFLDIEPVEVVGVADEPAFMSALERCLARGNPSIPTPSGKNPAKPVVLKYAKVSSWSKFEKESTCWVLSVVNGTWVFGRWKRRPDRGFEPDLARTVSLKHDMSTDSLVRLIVDMVKERK